MDILFDWTPNMSVGVKEIDEQHKKLINIINRLFRALKEGMAYMELASIIGDLTDYTKVHFRYEEKYFKLFKYPDAEKHIAEHQQFIEQVGLFTAELQEKKISLSFDVMDFLKNWLLNHILKSDKAYTQWFNNYGLK